jgi:3,4-dihydroxy 2-butanone 4-phosphate synthase/GTP cyclohydrolase II
MFHRTHQQNDALLTEGVSASDAMDALLHDLGQARLRKRPQGRPFVTLAYAQSIDGSISIARGQRSALSGPESLRLTHALRAGHEGILVGVGTVVADDPELRVRLVDGRDPQPVIVDSQLSTPVAAKLLAQKGRRPWIGTTTQSGGRGAAWPAGDAGVAAHDRRARIEARGARIFPSDPQANGWVDLAALLRQLYAEGIAHLMVEGGARIITSFLEARLVDYVAVTIAPVFMGGLAAVGPLDGRTPEGALTTTPTATGRATRTLPSPPPAAGGPGGPALSRWVSARLGHDLVMAGEVSWPAA